MNRFSLIFGMVFRIQFTFCSLSSATLSDLLSQNAVAVDSYRGIHSETAALPRKQTAQVLFHPIALLDKVSIGEVMLVLSCLLEAACLRADTTKRPFGGRLSWQALARRANATK